MLTTATIVTTTATSDYAISLNCIEAIIENILNIIVLSLWETNDFQGLARSQSDSVILWSMPNT